MAVRRCIRSLHEGPLHAAHGPSTCFGQKRLTYTYVADTMHDYDQVRRHQRQINLTTAHPCRYINLFHSLPFFLLPRPWWYMFYRFISAQPSAQFQIGLSTNVLSE